LAAVGVAIILAIAAFGAKLGATGATASETSAHGKIFVLMVWDGLRPDLADEVNTPNLFALGRAGVRFARHHAIYPTLTMVNAAGLATGAGPGGSGIFGDMMYLAPVLDMKRASALPLLGELLESPLNLEHSQYLAELNSPRAFDGRLLGMRTTAQEVEDAGGYVAAIGKQGPTLLFDDKFAISATNDGTAHDFVFVSDDMAAPQSMAAIFAHKPPMKHGDYASVIARDKWFANLVTERALPAAKAASDRGKPAFVVLWQHNPDLTEHHAGLGTRPALEALHASDANLEALRAAIAKLAIANRTDLMVVSDHGFATIKATVPLARLLVAAGLKKSEKSTEVVVSTDGGTDEIYLSRERFPNAETRRKVLRRIVEYAEAQKWCGPIFSRDSAAGERRGRARGYGGWIEGTFGDSVVGLANNARAADLIISFREFPNADNRFLTGPAHPAYTVGPDGPEAQENHSTALVHPVPGVIYADAGGFTSGMGMHGAAGARELHNFGAAIGPDFRRGLVDTAPTGNVDIAPTAAKILGQAPVEGSTGRVLQEALAGTSAGPGSHAEAITDTVSLQLKNSRVVTTLNVTRYAGREYLDGSTVAVTPSRKAQLQRKTVVRPDRVR
jgi:Type I phosphodiesterase / nucleotide pyrophosphatase